ncbi:MAG: AzlC family ABC transporter permease [Hyphomicrobiaceae bacterium]|nr:AzlC family ABC transporter permease [Hyphomicrobiaceae bacterium]
MWKEAGIEPLTGKPIVFPSDDYELPRPARDDAWWRGLSRLGVFRKGLAVALEVPGLILLASAAGFGALARDAGLTVVDAVFMMGVFFALPAQVVMVDQLARGGALMGGALVVMLTGVRLVPMCVLLTPYLKGPRATRPGMLLAAHFIAVTAWMEGYRRLPRVPELHRFDYFIGIGTGLLIASLVGTAAGFLLAGTVPSLIAAVLLFLTPVYFLLALLSGATERADYLAIVAGLLLEPPLFLMVPGFDLLITGLLGGTLAFFASRLEKRT